jgi:hypothetical protein
VKTYWKIFRASLKADDDRWVFVYLPAIAAVINLLDQQWWVALAFFVATSTGLRRSLDQPDVKLARVVSRLIEDYGTVEVKRNGKHLDFYTRYERKGPSDGN